MIEFTYYRITFQIFEVRQKRQLLFLETIIISQRKNEVIYVIIRRIFYANIFCSMHKYANLHNMHK